MSQIATKLILFIVPTFHQSFAVLQVPMTQQYEFIIDAIIYGMSTILCLWIMYKVFINLYAFGMVKIGCIKFCGIRFLQTHNWIEKPSTSNKIYALLTLMTIATLFIFRWIMDMVLYSIPNGTNEYYVILKFRNAIIYSVLKVSAKLLYFSYLILLRMKHQNHVFTREVNV